ncbi:hypothetical protein LLG95_10020 [bacterium]|nr:hypothetical protein [bacterium]
MPDDRKPEPIEPDKAELATFAVDYPDAASVSAESAEEWSDEPKKPAWRRRLERISRDPRLWFMLAMVVVFAVGAWQRCWRLDMPPFDNPAARQRSNIYAMDSFLHGAPILAARSEFHELQLYPWLAAKTYSASLGCETWTWARMWSVFWSMVMVAFAALAGYWSVASSRVSDGRRWLFALLAMAAVAFNPYHLALSRIITTEPMTLAFQTAALSFFLMAMARPNKIVFHILFVVSFTLAGLAKIPSLVWLPAFLLGYLAHRRIAITWKIVGLVAMAAGLTIVFWVYKLNPLTMIQTYATKYSGHSGQAGTWLFHELWYKSYFTRVVIMLTVPGVILAAVGMLVAPWTYRLTMLLLLFAFYFLNNLQSYNFSHMILPGMMLAIFGANFIIEAGSNRNLALGPRAQSLTPFAVRRLHQAYGLAIVLIIAATSCLNPPHDLTAKPYGQIIQALKVTDELVPPDASLCTNDQIFDFYPQYVSKTRRKAVHYSPTLNLSGGWFYSFNRTTVAHDISNSWVRWASLPGEYGSLLLTDKPAIMDVAEAAGYARLDKPAGSPPVEGLDLEAVLMPSNRIDQRRGVIRVEPGSQVAIGLQWNNTGGYKLARLMSRLDKWDRIIIPPPIREGGMVRGRGDLLCVPRQGRHIVRYTFDFPKNYPAGQYALFYYPITEEAASGEIATVRAYGLPIIFEVAASSEPTGKSIERRFIDLYPDAYLWETMDWNDASRFKDMKLDGITQAGTVIRILPCAGSPSGKYRLTLTGSGTPIYGSTPANDWPKVDVFLPERADTPTTTVLFNSEKTATFTTEFTATKPFDSIKFQITTRGATAGRTPFWLTDFAQVNYGPEALQYIHLGDIKLERLTAGK